MSKSPEELVEELIGHSETHQGLVPQSSQAHLDKLLSGEIGPDDSIHAWVLGVFIKEVPVILGSEPVKQPGVPRLELGPNYAIEDVENLETAYGEQYTGLVGGLQAIHRLKPQVKLDLESAVIEEARVEMLGNRAQLLGGVAIAQSANTGEVNSNFFVSRILIDVYGRALRDQALDIDVETIPEERKTDELVRSIFDLKQMRGAELVAVSAATLVAGLMPTRPELGNLLQD